MAVARGALVALVLSISTAACGHTTGGLSDGYGATSAAPRHATGHWWKPASPRGATARAARTTSWRRTSNWTIVGRSDASKSYPSREAFMSEVIRPFNARMREGLRPTIRKLYADGDTVIIFFDASGVATDGETLFEHLRMVLGDARTGGSSVRTRSSTASRSTSCGGASRPPRLEAGASERKDVGPEPARTVGVGTAAGQEHAWVASPWHLSMTTLTPLRDSARLVRHRSQLSLRRRLDNL